VNAGTAGQTFVNTAVISGGNDPNPGNDSDSASITVNNNPQPVVDLSVTKSVDDSSPDEGQIIAFTIVAANSASSTAAASGVVVNDALPAGVTFVSATASEGTYNSATDSWTGLSLAPGESQTLTILASVNAGTAGQALVNTAIITGPAPGDDPAPGNNQSTATATVNAVVQFITPMSLFRLAGPLPPPAPGPVNPPAPGTATIRGFKWHDLDQDGVWDAGEPARPGWGIFLDLDGDNLFDPQTERFAVTATDGSYLFDNLAPGTFFVREDQANLSAGTFQVQKFPAADPAGQRDPDEHRITVVAGQVVQGQSGIAQEPNFGSFDYSPLVRPADDSLRRFGTLSAAQQQTYLTASRPWQSFPVTNNTGRPLRITAINKVIDTSLIAQAGQFVTIFQRLADGSLVTPTLPIDVPAGGSVELFAFYDPKVLNGDTVPAQFPDWFDDPATGATNESRTRPPHTFAADDRLEVATQFTDSSPGAGPTFAARLVGGSTYDADIFYDSIVDRSDLGRLSDDLLTRGWPLVEGAAGSLFDPTSDANARHPNGAEQMVATVAWPAGGPPEREIGYGDFAVLSAEMARRRAPFIDLDADNSSGSEGVGYTATLAAGAAPIADFDTRFANRLDLELDSVQLTIANPPDGSSENFDFSNLPAGITGQSQFAAGVRTLTLSGTAAVELYAEALRSLRYTNADTTPTPGTRSIRIQATGGDDFISRDAAQQIIFDQRTGNVAVAQVSIPPAAPPAPIAPPDMSEGEGEADDPPPVAPLAYADWNLYHGSCEPPSAANAGDEDAAGPVDLPAWATDADRPIATAPATGDPAPGSSAASLAELLLAVMCDEETRARDRFFAQLGEDALDLLQAPE
jgi:uncharacterized repeat protein (TIGR01451 family)